MIWISVGGLLERIIHWLKVILNVFVPIYHNPWKPFWLCSYSPKCHSLTLSQDGWVMAHPCCSYSETLESWKKCSKHYLKYCPSHRADSSLEKKMVQLRCILTASKTLTFSGTGFNVLNRDNEFMLVTKTDLNLHLSLSITLIFHMLLRFLILMGNDSGTSKVTLKKFNRILNLPAYGSEEIFI